jgi:hypothetical protein
MIRISVLMCLAAILGVVVATSSSCVVGLGTGTGTWCGLPWFWLVGFPVALVSTLLLGVPTAFIFRKFHFERWWQFIIGGAAVAVPFWYQLAQPFGSARWQQSGFFDTLNYLGSGAFGGLFFWWLLRKLDGELSNQSLNTDAPKDGAPVS